MKNAVRSRRSHAAALCCLLLALAAAVWAAAAGRGPDICMQIVPTSFVYSTIEDSFVSAGINQTQHRVLIVFQAEMSAILPGYSVTVEVENEVCVAQTLIVGEVPQVYAARS